MKHILSVLYITVGMISLSAQAHKPVKIVGLVPARNEAYIITQCLKALACYTDAIVYLDDASDDNSVEIVQSLAQECHVERIITKDGWYRDEPGDRNKLLQAGREIGGTHFIVLDADEMLTANCMQRNFLRNYILKLKPGEWVRMNLIHLWRSVHNYRVDNASPWTNRYMGFIFCDDGVTSYSSDFIHTQRTPPLSGTMYTISGVRHGVLHFLFINWPNLLIKQAWYRCLEHIRDPQKPIEKINKLYGRTKKEYGIQLKPSHWNWFAGYTFFDPTIFENAEQWRTEQVLAWFTQYGRDYFAELDIWDINWPA